MTSGTKISAPPEQNISRRVTPMPLAVQLNDTSRITGLGRTKIYELIARGKLKTVAIGRRRLVLYSSIEALLGEGG